MSNQGEFSRYDYAEKLIFFRYTIKAPNAPSGYSENRRQWFERCHHISLDNFENIVEKREPQWFYDRVMQANRPLDLNQERKK